MWDATVLSPLSQPSGLYIQAPLAVVLTWDAATKQRLFFENFMMQKQADGKVYVLVGMLPFSRLFFFFCLYYK